MNKWSHLIAALALATMVFVIHILIRTDSNVNKLDVVRFYTMQREKGDVTTALSYLTPTNAALTDACARLTNLSGTEASTIACLTARRAVRDNVLNAMKCNKYSSQVCSYLQRMLGGIVSANKTISNTWFQGRDLTAKVPGYDLTFRQAIYNAVKEAPNILHNAFTAKQDNNLVVLRTILYNMITITVFANIVVHVSDMMPGWSWRWRLAMRVGYFVASFFLSIIFLFVNPGSATIVCLLIFVPAFVSLVYFEIFLDDPDERPWVHPYTFSIVFACTSLLSLTENNVLNGTVVIIELLKCQAASQLYMEVVWYWTGYMEKKRMHSELTEVYKTKQIQFALFMGVILVALFPFLQYVAPYDYTNEDVFLRLAPLIFTAISVVGTIFLQGLILDDEYGLDAKEAWNENSVGPLRRGENRGTKLMRDQIYRATKITGGKLGVSALVLIFVTLVQFEFVAEYFRTLRAYQDTMPEKSIQYDLSRTFLWGTGLLTPSVYTL
jgi:hypothetical protein